MIGKNYDHYFDLWISDYKYNVLNEPKKKVKGSFNWLALLAAPLVWFAYRRMYTYYFVTALMFCAMTFVENYYDLNSVSLLGAMLVFVIYSKDFYFGHLVGCIKKIDSMPNNERRASYLHWRRGVSVLYAFLAVPVFFVFGFVTILLAECLKDANCDSIFF